MQKKNQPTKKKTKKQKNPNKKTEEMSPWDLDGSTY